MRKDAGNTYGLVPRKLVAMLSHDGTAWFVDELVETTDGFMHRPPRPRRPKTPPPTYERVMKGDEEGKDNEDVNSKSVPVNDSTSDQRGLDLLSQDNIEHVITSTIPNTV